MGPVNCSHLGAEGSYDALRDIMIRGGEVGELSLELTALVNPHALCELAECNCHAIGTPSHC